MMRTTLTILTLLTLGAGALGAQPAVRLHSRATVAAEAVRLADVATLEGLPAHAAQAVVVNLPAIGQGSAVDLAAVEGALRSAGVNVALVAFRGASVCRVQRIAQADPPAPQASGGLVANPQEPAPSEPASVTDEQAPSQAKPQEALKTEPAPASGTPSVPTLGERIVELLCSQLHCRPEELQIDLDPVSADSASLRVEGLVSITSTDRHLLGRRHWRAEITQHNRRYRRYISGTVSVRRQVVVARRDLLPGQVVGPQDVGQAIRGDAGAGWMTDLQAVLGRQMTSAVLTGEPIPADALERPVLVRRGEMTAVEYRTGGLTVSLNARALRDGQAGQRVEFENPSNRRRLWAVVTGPATATVVPEEATP